MVKGKKAHCVLQPSRRKMHQINECVMDGI